MRSVLHQKLRIFPFSSNEYVGRPTPKSVLYRINQVLIKPLFSHLKARCSHLPFKKVRFLEVTNLGLRPRDLAKPTLTVGKRDVPGPVFSYSSLDNSWQAKIWAGSVIPANTRHWINAGLTLVHRIRSWTNVKPTFFQLLVSAGISYRHITSWSVRLL